MPLALVFPVSLTVAMLVMVTMAVVIFIFVLLEPVVDAVFQAAVKEVSWSRRDAFATVVTVVVVAVGSACATVVATRAACATGSACAIVITWLHSEADW